MQNPLVPVKNFARRHKTMVVATVAVTVTAALSTVITANALKQHNEFLKDHGLYDEFYADQNTDA